MSESREEIPLTSEEVVHIEPSVVQPLHAVHSATPGTASATDPRLPGPVLPHHSVVPVITQPEVTVKKMTSIESAKDKAQIASSAAMSVVHVALLKNVLDTGPEGDRYYSLRLGLIIAALVLQVFGGVIALYIGLLRNYYSQYKEDFLGDFSKMCCPWKCNCSFRKRGIPPEPRPPRPRNSRDIRPGCCPCWCVPNSYYEYEYNILDRYEEVTENCINADIDAANCNHQLAWIKQNLAELEAEETSLKVDEVGNAHRLEEILKEKEKLKKEQETEEDKKQKAVSLMTQKLAMDEHVMDIYQQRVLKQATFWQNVLNFIFYGVFVLNALITGFGLASSGQGVPAAGNHTLTQ